GDGGPARSEGPGRTALPDPRRPTDLSRDRVVERSVRLVRDPGEHRATDRRAHDARGSWHGLRARDSPGGQGQAGRIDAPPLTDGVAGDGMDRDSFAIL